MMKPSIEFIPRVFSRPSRLSCRSGWDGDTTNAFETLEFESLELKCDPGEAMRVPNLGAKAARVERLELRVPGDLSGVDQFVGLKSIDMPIGLPRNGISLGAFRRLEHIFAQWSNQVTQELKSCQGIRSIGAMGWNLEDLSCLANVGRLEELSFSQGSLQSLAGIDHHEALFSLSLAYLRNFDDLDSILGLSSLKSVDIENLPKLKGDIPVSRFKSLRALRVVASGVRVDFSEVGSLRNLETVLVNGACVNVDLFSVIAIPSVRLVSIPVGEGRAGLEEELLAMSARTGKKMRKLSLVGPKRQRIAQFEFATD